MIIIMKFMLGVNYWGRDYATEMWQHYDGARIRDELTVLSGYGVRCMRVFPNWRDFQPVESAYRWRGAHGEYLNSNTGAQVYDDGVDPEQIECFRDFCHAAEENGITLVVSVVTGWMSGRLYTPPALSGKNLINDPEALMWMRRFIHRFVRELKNEKAIVMWDLGNECNCLGMANSRYEAYVWTSTVADSIRAEDPTRPISSGMHSLHSYEKTEEKWFIQDQGEMTDVLTPHPYPSPTIKCDNEPYNRLKITFAPTAQALYYSGIGKRNAYIQESGTFSQTVGNKEMSADWLRINVLSSIANNLIGYQWWCAWDQSHLDFPPYTWHMIERELGIMKTDGSPKPVAYAMKEMSALLDKLPDEFPKRQIDGACILTEQGCHQETAIATLTLAKQAGIDLEVVYTQTGDIPDTSLYFMPRIGGWNVINKATWTALLNKVQEGATLYISYEGGQITSFPEIIGAESMGVMSGVSHSFELDGCSLPYSGKEILLSPTTAEVVAVNEKGNPVLLKNKLDKGTVYFMNAAIEGLAFDTVGAFTEMPYYLIYSEIARDVVSKKAISCADPNVFVTVNPISEEVCYATILNYSDHEIIPKIRLQDGWTVSEAVYGSLNKLPSCNGAIVKLARK
jgi:hypothetical protein